MEQSSLYIIGSNMQSNVNNAQMLLLFWPCYVIIGPLTGGDDDFVVVLTSDEGDKNSDDDVDDVLLLKAGSYVIPIVISFTSLLQSFSASFNNIAE